MRIITGFEPSRIIGKDSTKLVDVLETTQHYTRYKEDLSLLREVGITNLRVAVPWHRIELEEGIYTWEWMDNYMEEVRRLGIHPILDCIHHTSFPTWIEGGYLNPSLSNHFIKFFNLLLYRYSWVEDWTIINEPYVTLLFCTDGTWYPFIKDNSKFHLLLEEWANIITLLSEKLKERGKNHIYIDSCEEHRAIDDMSRYYCEDRNRCRFLLLDKLKEKNCYITTLGIDYYAHSEFEWSCNGREPTNFPSRFSKVALAYYHRYQIPLMLTETNIRGYITDRQNWFVHMYKECQKLSRLVPFEGFCWYPFIDSTDWDSLITKADCHIDPQGIIWLDDNFNRHTSQFSDNISKLIKGDMTIDQFPIYPYQPPLDYHLGGFQIGD